MISLEIQIMTFAASFVFGIITFLLYKISKKFIVNINNIMRFLVSIIFIIDLVLLYFLMLRTINDGVFHIYFALVSFVGVFIANYVSIKYFK